MRFLRIADRLPTSLFHINEQDSAPTTIVNETITQVIRNCDREASTNDSGIKVIVLYISVILLALIAILIVYVFVQKRKKFLNAREVANNRIKAQSATISELKEQTAQLRNEYPTQSDYRQKVTSLANSKFNFNFKFKADIFRTSKSDESIDLCADMASVNVENQTFSIADGVSQAFNSAGWSKILIDFVNLNNEIQDLTKNSEKLSALWDEQCKAIPVNESESSFIKQKQEQGSQSTLASLRLLNRNGKDIWQFNTVGDSLLIVLDESENGVVVRKFFPFTSVESFPSSPDVISTRFPFLKGHMKVFEFEASETQQLLLMTDALGRYAVANTSIGDDIFLLFPFLRAGVEQYLQWVDTARKNGLGDDDSTMIAIHPHHE